MSGRPLSVSPEQARRLFEQIVATAGAAGRLAGATACDGDTGSGNPWDALLCLEYMLQQIGALADHALGGQCIGSVADWACAGFPGTGAEPAGRRR